MLPSLFPSNIIRVQNWKISVGIVYKNKYVSLWTASFVAVHIFICENTMYFYDTVWYLY